ncbi:hypothetical protein EHQ46_09860 [Leptospira yanagawae]|uniref:Lipoprotein n=1 Tax=Leptospira yanagawae TaxID=293069 RepID=A0ABY2M4F8_9LEPT|nr:hypothetical protein [Leptospira yanagawae]TGL20794.1 hypothetical protein EHQ46_09860 [Leptospira yanagawae]
MCFEKKLRIFILLICFLLVGCDVSLRVYRPFPNEKEYDFVKKMDHIQVEVKDENRMKMGLFDPFFFDAQSLENEYGPLSYLIRKELSIREQRFPLLIERGGNIRIESFELVSLDRCHENLTYVRLKGNFQIRGFGQEDFDYYDEILSHVTNCYLLGSTITILPLVWYVPYSGFRGNREDQINQLGRNALNEFFNQLELSSGFQNNAKVMRQDEIKTPPTKKKPKTEEPMDPKLKEIIDSL